MFLPSLANVPPVARAQSSPYIYSVSGITANPKGQIIIQGSGFGNNFPTTVPSGDGCVNTEGSPSIEIWDITQGWYAGRVGDPIGICLLSWNDTTIVINGFGSNLGTGVLIGGVCETWGYGAWRTPGQWWSPPYGICTGDEITIEIWGPTGMPAFQTVTAVLAITTSLSRTAMAVGDSVSDTATLYGATLIANGTVTYEYFSGYQCSGSSNVVGPAVTVTDAEVNGWVQPSSDLQTFYTYGNYSWNAIWNADSGNINNMSATSPCEPLTVKNSTSILTTLSAVSITVGNSVFDTAKLSGETSNAHGTVQYEYFSSSTCSGSPTPVGKNVTLTSGKVPRSSSLIFSSRGSYGWEAYYSGDWNDYNATSPCEPLAVDGHPTSTTVSCNLAPVAVGLAATCAATVKVKAVGPVPTGTVTWSSSQPGRFSPTSCKLSQHVSYSTCSVTFTPNTAKSPVTIKALYGGDSKDSPSNGTTSLAVIRAKTVASITCTKSTFAVGTSVTCTATVTGSAPSHTGTITWSKFSGTGKVAFIPPTCKLSAGKCSVTVKGVAAGSVTIEASYSGDSNNLGSSKEFTLKIVS